MEKETFKDIAGFEKLYQVSDRCKYFDGSEERRCFVNCVLGRKVEQTDKGFESFDISFGGEVT